jgi:hypothetical protein
MGVSPFQVVVMQTAPHPIEQRGGLSNFGQIEVEARGKFNSKFQVQRLRRQTPGNPGTLNFEP